MSCKKLKETRKTDFPDKGKFCFSSEKNFRFSLERSNLVYKVNVIKEILKNPVNNPYNLCELI